MDVLRVAFFTLSHHYSVYINTYLFPPSCQHFFFIFFKSYFSITVYIRHEFVLVSGYNVVVK